MITTHEGQFMSKENYKRFYVSYLWVRGGDNPAYIVGMPVGDGRVTGKLQKISKKFIQRSDLHQHF
jgi:hypothetical protein